MKTNDIVNEYDRGAQSSKRIVAKLKQLGYTLLGDGFDATVWAKDEGSIIKILMPHRTSKDTTLGDDAFMTFYEFCVEHKASPYLPKFVSIGGADHTVFTLNGLNYRQISMEELDPIPGYSFMESMIWGMSDLEFSQSMTWGAAKQKLTESETWKYYHGDAGRMPGKDRMEHEVIQMLSDPAVEKMYAGLFEVMRALFLFGKRRGWSWDLHTENVMVRGNTPVIIDPFTG